MGRRTPEWKIEKIPKLVREGLGLKAISERLGLNTTTLSNHIRKQGLSGTATLRKRIGSV